MRAHAVLTALPATLLVLLVAVGCFPRGDKDGSGGPTPSPTATTHPDGPKVESFSLNVDEMTEDGAIELSALVSDPDGLDDIVGGVIEDAKGAEYGQFTPVGGGSFTHTLTWDTVDQRETIEFDSEERRPLVARFFDAAGHDGIYPFEVRLHCDGVAAINGACIGVHSGTYTYTSATGSDGCELGWLTAVGNSTALTVNATHVLWDPNNNGNQRQLDQVDSLNYSAQTTGQETVEGCEYSYDIRESLKVTGGDEGIVGYFVDLAMVGGNCADFQYPLPCTMDVDLGIAMD